MSILVSRCVDKAKEEIQIIITNSTILLVIAVIYSTVSVKSNIIFLVLRDIVLISSAKFYNV